jgi:hypothetical protein
MTDSPLFQKSSEKGIGYQILYVAIELSVRDVGISSQFLIAVAIARG